MMVPGTIGAVGPTHQSALALIQCRRHSLMARKATPLKARATQLEMTAPPKGSLPVPVNLHTAIIRATEIPLHYHRYLYRRIGKRWHWYQRLRLSDEELAAI